MRISCINSLEHAEKVAFDDHLIKLRKKDGEGLNPFAQMGIVFRTRPNSLIADPSSPDKEEADKGLGFREGLFSSNKWFKEDWFMEGEFIKLLQNYVVTECEG